MAYGNDYDDRNWIERAGDTVRGWFGSGRDYDQDYGWSGDRGPSGRWKRDSGYSAGHPGWQGGGMSERMPGGYDRMDYPPQRGVDRGVREGYGARGWDRGNGYDFDYGADWSRGGSGGMGMRSRGAYRQ